MGKKFLRPKRVNVSFVTLPILKKKIQKRLEIWFKITKFKDFYQTNRLQFNWISSRQALDLEFTCRNPCRKQQEKSLKTLSVKKYCPDLTNLCRFVFQAHILRALWFQYPYFPSNIIDMYVGLQYSATEGPVKYKTVSILYFF